MDKTKSGYVTIVGLPNAGKSTLLNSLLGQKLSITSSKPQTTRKRILGILSEPKYQIVFLDTPGILEPKYLLQEKMLDWIHLSVRDADIIVLIVDAAADPKGELLLNNELVSNLLKESEIPKIIIYNKIDLSNQDEVTYFATKCEEMGLFKKIIPLSASMALNVSTLLNELVELLPEGEKFYPDDIVADEHERFFVTEIIREKIFEQYKEEIPYSVEVVINEFKEQPGRKDVIRAEIFVERDTQRKIIIGKQGSAIKELGIKARKDVEAFLGRDIFLELRVKVKEKWRDNEKILKNLGYSRDAD
jgi:GTPase